MVNERLTDHTDYAFQMLRYVTVYGDGLAIIHS